MDKKSAITAHIMRDKRVPIIILYYVSDKKAAVTSLLFNNPAQT
jgi:hypothetical protein